MAVRFVRCSSNTRFCTAAQRWLVTTMAVMAAISAAGSMFVPPPVIVSLGRRRGGRARAETRSRATKDMIETSWASGKQDWTSLMLPMVATELYDAWKKATAFPAANSSEARFGHVHSAMSRITEDVVRELGMEQKSSSSEVDPFYISLRDAERKFASSSSEVEPFYVSLRAAKRSFESLEFIRNLASLGTAPKELQLPDESDGREAD
eukprot:TRINITY_DN70871_c0_g1_i1.p1 TRINITY_DN70871_c0_g1~~TRINITY_DN70871_c0_g1_i1.p1  ORF type:complete len:208 (-),score=35.21 TRINITY_DN70871_c0_g1_i1:94-717(-)